MYFEPIIQNQVYLKLEFDSFFSKPKVRYMKEQILELRSKGLSYREITEKLGCSKSTVSYYCGSDQKKKSLDRQRRRRENEHPFKSKLERFCLKKNRKAKTQICSIKALFKGKLEAFHMKHKSSEYQKPTFTVDDVIAKFGESPTCYLTGDSIDIHNPRSYQFDHIIPRSRGGDNSLDNLGLCTRHANIAKSDMTPEEFVEFCRSVVDHHDNK